MINGNRKLQKSNRFCDFQGHYFGHLNVHRHDFMLWLWKKICSSRVLSIIKITLKCRREEKEELDREIVKLFTEGCYILIEILEKDRRDRRCRLFHC